MGEDLYLRVESVAAIQSVDRLANLGRVLDAFPEFAPVRMGHRDPPRTIITSVEEQLGSWAPRIHPGDYFNQFMSRPRDPRTWGLLWIVGDIWNYPPISPHVLEYGVEETWFSTPDMAGRLERYAALFGKCCEVMNASYARAGLTSVRRQANDMRFAAQVAGTLDWPGMPGTGWDVGERALVDIAWLNYFGPAYFERWAAKPLADVGVRQEPTSNGGLIVWATETPFVFDVGARRLTDYPWKAPFYRALGMDSLIHEDWRDPGRGVLVPTYEDHRRAAEAHESGST